MATPSTQYDPVGHVFVRVAVEGEAPPAVYEPAGATIADAEPLGQYTVAFPQGNGVVVLIGQKYPAGHVAVQDALGEPLVAPYTPPGQGTAALDVDPVGQ